MSYASSSALSPAHYRLVKGTDAAQPDELVHRIAHEVDGITRRLQSSNQSSAKAIKTDLVMALYCQSISPTPLNMDGIIPAALKLAGGGGGARSDATTLEHRKFGYTACDQLFTEAPHSLKLLIINTIRSDLYVPAHHPQAQLRWSMALRAASSPRLITPELIPVISDRLQELFSDHRSSASIKRLVLATLLSLVRLDFASGGSLISTTRRLVLDALAPRKLHLDPYLLSALVNACRIKSPIYPISSSAIIVGHYLDVLLDITGGEWKEKKWSYHGVQCGWLSNTVLEGMAELINGEETHDRTSNDQITRAVLAFLDPILSSVDLAFGLLLSAISCFSTLPSTAFDDLEPSDASTLSRTLQTIRSHLDSKNPNLRILALKCLERLPKGLWEDQGNELWGGKAWKRILSGLDNKDENLRIATLRLVHHMGPALAELHRSRLLKALSSHPAPTTSSLISSHSKILSLLLETSSILDTNPQSWANRVLEIIETANLESEVLSPVVVKTVDRFGDVDDEWKKGFGEELWMGNWRKSLTGAALVAATIGLGNTGEERRAEFVEGLARFVANEDGPASPRFLDPLKGPFLLSILRLLSNLPSSYTAPILDLLNPLTTTGTDDVQQLLSLLSLCSTSSLAQGNLHSSALDKRNSTLPGFYEALLEYFGDGLTLQDDIGARGEWSGSDARVAEGFEKNGNQAPMQTENGKGKEREGDLERDSERTERGGRGGRLAESLMTPGALALLGVGERAFPDDVSPDFLPYQVTPLELTHLSLLFPFAFFPSQFPPMRTRLQSDSDLEEGRFEREHNPGVKVQSTSTPRADEANLEPVALIGFGDAAGANLDPFHNLS
ncbi:hypothetical protein P7C70_g1311, partial [Phenoliferia sp. Uapishka_3]